MGLLALAIAPGIAICIFIYFNDKNNKEPFSLLLLSFFVGILSTVPAIIIQLVCTKPLNAWLGNGLIYISVLSYGLIAVSEEGSKFMMLRLFPFKRLAFDEPFDGIVYSVMVSMGFATLENIGYVFENGYATGVMRLFFSVPAHATFAILMGYYLGLAKFFPKKRYQFYALAILLPVLFHGTFDFFLLSGKTSLHILGALASFYIAIRLSRQAIKKNTEISERYYLRKIIN